MGMEFRQKFILKEAMSYEAIMGLYTRSKTFINCILKQDSKGLFFITNEESIFSKGDVVIVYSVDSFNIAEILDANGLFNEHFYADQDVFETQDIWPDEALFIDHMIASSGNRILEICSGNGRVTSHLCKDGNTVVGLDNCLESISLAQKHQTDLLSYVHADAFKLPFEKDCFDISCCFENSLGMFLYDEETIVQNLIEVSKQKVIFGLRQVNDSTQFIHYYASQNGYLEFGKVFSHDSFEVILNNLNESYRNSIAAINYYPGLPRPWGGEQFFVVLDLV